MKKHKMDADRIVDLVRAGGGEVCGEAVFSLDSLVKFVELIRNEEPSAASIMKEVKKTCIWERHAQWYNGGDGSALRAIDNILDTLESQITT